MSRPERKTQGRLLVLFIVGAALFLAALNGGFFWPVPMIFAGAGASVLLVGILSLWVSHGQGRADHKAMEIFAGFIEKDAAPSFITDDEGEVLARNSAAAVRFSGTREQTFAAELRSVFANPDAVIYRLQCRARLEGNAREDVVTRRGHVRLAVHVLEDARFLWRFEDVQERSSGGKGSEALPMLTVGRGGAVLFMNDAARVLVGQRVKSMDRLFADLPLENGSIVAISTAEGNRSVVVSELGKSSVRKEIFLTPISPETKVSGADFDTLPVPMLKLDAEGCILGINGLARELLGPGAQPGTQISEVMHGLARQTSDWLRENAREDAGSKSEFLRLSRNDRETYVQATLSRAQEDGKTVFAAVLSDATELKTLEAKFVQSQKMQAIGQLAGGVAHDFNNLLTAISGHCDLLLLRHDQGDPDYGDLVQIHQNANRAAALVSQLLAFSRKQTLRPETLDLRDTLSDLTHLLNRLVGERVTLTLSHDPVLKPIRADKRQLEQVLMNLVVNARDAMPEGGEIRVDTEVVTLDKPVERNRAVLPAGEYVTVKVSDEGIGIEPGVLQKVFEPFYTTKRTGEGTGLGLSTVYGIIKQTGGYIFVDSVPGQGTEFILYFPVSEAEEPVADITSESTPATVHKNGDGVVLLVEDEAPVRAFASRALRLRGYTVLEAESAEDALNMLQDKDLAVDVFVTDVVMPGLDGPTWVRQALEDRPDVRVVFVSGYAQGAFSETGPQVPNSVFLPKPFSLNQLTETVFQQLH
ncbi:ATP-binding protein [Ruegeria sp. 2205SS24-7]|uniref:ATP-binding protein n=1 Tax=Ruegeria discodermiae TaxID=3064389 RepID=UPI00274195E3|nr:ATP-binding protein [Ruegeria sp. 2205SS24-7]MDP5216137.1 ATP-binding protein [Ruegeria sp. 2205SS24-7]